MALDDKGLDESTTPDGDNLLTGLPEIIDDTTLFTSSGASIPVSYTHLRAHET